MARTAAVDRVVSPRKETDPSRRRLALVSPSHWAGKMGGAELQMRYLLDHLVNLDRVEIAYFARDTDPSFKPTGYEIVPLSDGARRKRTIMEVARLSQCLRKFQPDVIYQRCGGAYTGIAAWYASRSNSRMVWHIAHDSDVTPGMVLSNSIVRPSGWLQKRALEFGIHRADRIIAQTTHQQSLLLTHYGRAAAAIIRNFHPIPEVRKKSEEPIVCMWIANFKPMKQPDALLRLARSRPGRRVRFLVIGRAEGRRNRSLVTALEAMNNVELLGELANEKVNSLLTDAHLLVNTSIAEGFPNTFIQAWLREVPVLSLTVDPDDVLSREGLGVCADGSEDRLASALEALAEDGPRRNRIGQLARSYAIRTHSLSNIDAIVSLLEQSD